MNWIVIDRKADKAYGPFENKEEAFSYGRNNFYSFSVVRLYKPPITIKSN